MHEVQVHPSARCARVEGASGTEADREGASQSRAPFHTTGLSAKNTRAPGRLSRALANDTQMAARYFKPLMKLAAQIHPPRARAQCRESVGELLSPSGFQITGYFVLVKKFLRFRVRTRQTSANFVVLSTMGP